MEKLIHFLILVLLSSVSILVKADDVFITLDTNWKNSSQKIEVTNMPRERDQDSTPFCPGFGHQIILQHAYCVENNIKDCSKVPPEKEFSPLSVMARCYEDSTNKNGTNNYYYYGVSNHSNVPINKSRQNDVICSSSLIASKSKFNTLYYSEACYPFDQFANRFPVKTHQKAYLNEVIIIEKYYDKYKTEGSICEECFLKDVNAFLYPTVGMKSPSSIELLASLKQKTKDKMWFELFGFQNCNDRDVPPVKLKEKYNFHVYPGDAIIKSYAQAKQEFLKAFSKNRPVSLGLCIAVGPDGLCEAGHDFAIYGFDRMCKKNNPNTCVDAVKLQDTMGKDFYPKDENGNPLKWIDAEKLFTYINNTKNPNISTVSMSWIEPEN